MSAEKNEKALHPTPQFARAGWTDLCGAWGFAHDDENRGLGKLWQDRTDVFDRAITVPFPPESPASGIEDPAYHPVVWYRRTFTPGQDAAGKRLVLHCGAVDYRARVWVNGRLVATHEGGHTPFSADVTDALTGKGEQTIVIRAEDDPLDLAQPRGKQEWLPDPHAIWYHRTTGIWQPVWIETIAPTHIAEARWTPDAARRALGLDVSLRHAGARPSSLRLRVRLTLRDTTLADDTYTVSGDEVHREITLDRGPANLADYQVLWSPEHPNLIEATLTLYAGDEPIDEVQSYAGLRDVGTSGRRFLLNGHPYYLRLALEQGYWPESHLAAPGAEALRREVELAKELGFNGVRIHQKVEDPRFLYFCDRLGLLVWGEMANTYVYTRTAAERVTREWLEAVRRDYSHPCIVVWVPLNESWGVPNLLRDAEQRHYVRALYHLTKSLDPTRLVIGNDGWEYAAGDIVSIHDYAFDAALLRERYGDADALDETLYDVQPSHRAIVLPDTQRVDEPVMLTEFGGISYRPSEGEEWSGYGTVTSRDAFLSRYRDLVDAVLDSSALAGFCYTQLTDTRQETNGLLTERREHKLDPARVRAITARAAASMAADVNRQGQRAQED